MESTQLSLIPAQSISKISGPVSVTTVSYLGIKYIFFSDVHQSFQGVCEDPCENNCYSAYSAIQEVIEAAAGRNEYVDVYFEKAFFATDDPNSLIYDDDPDGPLPYTTAEFSNCLYRIKATCPYSNGRFHYIDIRNIYTPGLQDTDLASWIYTMIYNTTRQNNMTAFWQKHDIMSTHINFFETRFLVETFLNNDDFIKSNLYVYYTMVIESDDFINDFTSYFGSLLQFEQKYIDDTVDLLVFRFQDRVKSSPEVLRKSVRNVVEKSAAELITQIYNICCNPIMIVTRQGKTMHRIRAQLFALELQGNPQRANSIRQFIYDKFNNIKLEISRKYFSNRDIIRYQHIVSEPRIEGIDDAGLERLIIIGALLVDCYTISRMFRTYPVQYRKETKSSDEHIMPSTVIEYAGELHIDNMVEYLTSMGGEAIKYPAVSEDYKRCVMVPSNIFE